MPQSTIVRWSDPKLILVATNLIEDHAFTLHSIYQARASRARVLLVHTIQPAQLRTEATQRMSIVQPDLVVRDAQAKLGELAAEFLREGIECEPIILSGPPEEQIPLFAKARCVDRIIIAARTASGVERLIGGSVVDAVILRVDVPVCTIGRHTRPDPSSTFPPSRILLATSLELESQMLVSFASTLAEQHHSHLTLLHVLDSGRTTEQDRELARFDVRKRLLGLIPKGARHRHQPVVLIPDGDPASVIPDAAETLLQDLVILGGPSPSLFSWILGTGVVHRVIDVAKCPVITIRSPTNAAINKEYLQDAIDVDATLAHSKECSEEAISSR